jgi:lysozyme
MTDLNTGKLLDELKRDEGVRLKAYRCTAGKLTVGIGRNLDDKGITLAEAEALCRNDVAEVIESLDRRLPWWQGLDDARQRVLVNMAFNMGVDGLLQFKATLALVQARRFAEASGAMLASLWAKQVGPRAIRLAGMMEKGS